MERFPRSAIVMLVSSVLKTMVAVDCYMVEIAVAAFMEFLYSGLYSGGISLCFGIKSAFCHARVKRYARKSTVGG